MNAAIPRTESNAAILPMRFSVGGVLWWNPDYAHYQFLSQYPDYDWYLFVEYDCVVQCPLEQFVAHAASRGADFVALPITRHFSKWHWMPYQRDVYSPDEVKLALLNICLFSAPALTMLHQRRLAMHADPSMRSWPSSEVFVPTEVGRAGMSWSSLAEFGDVSHCDWFPPTMEEDLRPSDGDVPSPVEHGVQEDVAIAWPQIFLHRRRDPVTVRNVAKIGQRQPRHASPRNLGRYKHLTARPLSHERISAHGQPPPMQQL